MDQINQLIELILTWRALIKTKESKYKTIANLSDRVRPALELINLKMELSMMEDELCSHMQIPNHLYAYNPKNPHQA